MSIQKMTTSYSSLSISRASELLGIARSSYYYWKEHSATGQSNDPEEEKILKEIKNICGEFTGYGYRRMHVELKNRSFLVNHKRVHRIMKENGLLCKKKKRYRLITTDSDHQKPVYPNQIKDLEVTGLNQVWVSDITYIELKKGYVYLATILDIYSRKCIGWKLSQNIDTELVLDALKMAIQDRWKPSMNDLIHHSDRGVQYASEKYTQFLENHNIKISMSRKGNPYDNAYAESFFKTLKCEEVYLNEYHDVEDALRNIWRFIEDVYNLKRLHSSLGYMSPVDFEKEVALNSVA